MQNSDTQNSDAVEGVGCACVLLAINAALMGLCAVSLVRGPYSSIEQELWYGYGSLGFLLAGAALPAFALFRGRPRWLVYGTVPWMMVSLLGFAAWIMMSGGGV